MPRCLQHRANLIARRAADYIEMRDVVLAEIPRVFQGSTGQGGRIGGGDFTAARIPTVEVREFGSQDGGLHFVHAAIAAVFGSIDTCCSTRIDAAISLYARGARREW